MAAAVEPVSRAREETLHFHERLREKTRQAIDHKPVPLPDDALTQMDPMAEHREQGFTR